MDKACDKLRDRAQPPGLGIPIRCSSGQWLLLPPVLLHTLFILVVCLSEGDLRPVGLFPGAATMLCWVFLNAPCSYSHEPVIVAWSVLLLSHMAWLPGYREYLGGGAG